MHSSATPAAMGTAIRVFALSLLVGSCWSTGRADGRFVVPTGPSENSNSTSNSSNNYTPPPPPPPSNHTPPPSYTPPPSNHLTPDQPRSGGRFNVPTPHGTGSPSRPGPGGDSSYGGGWNNGYGGYDPYPYWGGCYYWNGDYYYFGGYRWISHYGSFDRYRYSEYQPSGYRQVPADKPAIFFPPSPPPLNAPVPPRETPLANVAAPAQLAEYVYEPFYAPLSTRLREQDLTKKLMARIETYRTKRTALRSDLLRKLDATKDSTPTERVQILEGFAQEQAAAIRALEDEAEDLRTDLLRGGLIGLFSGTGDWNESRGWVLGKLEPTLPKSQALMYQFLVMRAAVFYQDGLSPAQRYLLREVAMELQAEAFKPADQARATPKETMLFFSPDTARIGVPEDLPADLAAKIAAYKTRKDQLKEALRATLFDQDSASPNRREQALEKLAERQAPEIASLEALADDIRSGLTHVPGSPGNSVFPQLPPELAARIGAYNREKQAVQTMIQEKLDEIRDRVAPGRYRLRKVSDDDTQHYRIEDGKRRITPEQMQKLKLAIAEFNRENASRFESLTREQQALRADVAAFAAQHPDPAATKSVQSLMDNFADALKQQENAQRYEYYRAAVLQPGLSSEQRRLLFEVALEKLALPLPDGEVHP